MALPAQRINLATNPSLGTAATGYFQYGTGTPVLSWQSGAGAKGNGFARVTFGGAATLGDGGVYGSDRATVAGEVWTFLGHVRSNKSTRVSLGIEWRTSGAYLSASYGPEVVLTANTWTPVYITGATAPATATIARLVVGARVGTGSVAFAAADTFDFDGLLQEKTATLGEYFDGSTTHPNYKMAWTGTAHASTSTRDVYGIWVEQVAGVGAPKVQVTAIGLGGVPLITKVTRQAGREVWTVPGWKARNTLGGDTYPDWTAPLGVPVTYTLFAAGQPINNMTITVTSTTGWVQDPLNPETAMPVALNGDSPNMLSLAKPALKGFTYSARFDEEYPLGGAYPIARAQTRSAPQGVRIFLNAQTNAVSDALLNLVRDTPILLFRGLPSWGSIPSLAYTIGDVEEAPLNRDVGGGFTQWLTGGKLVAPVSLGPVQGIITNQMVADNLVGRTNASVAASSGTKRNIDIQANPLSLGQ